MGDFQRPADHSGHAGIGSGRLGRGLPGERIGPRVEVGVAVNEGQIAVVVHAGIAPAVAERVGVAPARVAPAGASAAATAAAEAAATAATAAKAATTRPTAAGSARSARSAGDLRPGAGILHAVPIQPARSHARTARPEAHAIHTAAPAEPVVGLRHGDAARDAAAHHKRIRALALVGRSRSGAIGGRFAGAIGQGGSVQIHLLESAAPAVLPVLGQRVPKRRTIAALPRPTPAGAAPSAAGLGCGSGGGRDGELSGGALGGGCGRRAGFGFGRLRGGCRSRSGLIGLGQRCFKVGRGKLFQIPHRAGRHGGNTDLFRVFGKAQHLNRDRPDPVGQVGERIRSLVVRGGDELLIPLRGGNSGARDRQPAGLYDPLMFRGREPGEGEIYCQHASEMLQKSVCSHECHQGWRRRGGERYGGKPCKRNAIDEYILELPANRVGHTIARSGLPTRTGVAEWRKAMLCPTLVIGSVRAQDDS